MTSSFNKEFWEQHWRRGQGGRPGSMSTNPPNPYLDRETSALSRGTVLDAGCGAGAEAIWLAGQGWHVTAVDISSAALALAAERARTDGVSGRIEWVEADLESWDPGTLFDLVTTQYAHASMPQLQLYERIASWVAPRGTLLIVGHGRGSDEADGGDSEVHEHRHHPPAEVGVTPASVVARLGAAQWEVVTAEEHRRVLSERGGEVQIEDVVVRATRRG